ncbi:response regulator transcription factor [Streptomyces sp. CO7]
MPLLTEQELLVFQHLHSGPSNADLAQKLSVTPRTIKFHITNIREKLGGITRLQACLLSALIEMRGEARSSGPTREMFVQAVCGHH